MKLALGPRVRVLAICTLACACARAADAPPPAPSVPATDDYFGTAVVDPYRNLENLADPRVQSWMKAEADYTRSTLDALPGRAALLERIHQLDNTDAKRRRFVRRGQRYFYLLVEPGARLPKLYVRDGLHGAERLLLDPAKLGTDASTHFSLDYFEPSWDGRHVAVGVSRGGSEQSTLQVLEADTGRTLGEAIERTSNSVIYWRPDNRGFYYLRYVKPAPGMPASQRMYNARTYLHTLGERLDGQGDPVVFGRGVAKGVDVPEGQVTYVALAPDSRFAVAVANHNNDANPSTFYVAPLATVNGRGAPWRKFADVEDGITQFVLRGDAFVFLSRKDAPRYRVLSLSLAHPDLARAKVLAPQGDAVITGLAAAREGLYLSERAGAVFRLVRVDWDGRKSRTLALPFEGTVSGLVADPLATGLLFGLGGWLQPLQRMAYDPDTDAVLDTGLDPPSKVDFSPYASREVFAVSYDGTRIPLSIIYKRGLALDGSHPALLSGYGSYGISSDPASDPMRLAWLERGGISAIAHVRGGGEYGEDWHRAGQMQTKLNTVFDFIACGQYLVDEGYTSPRRLIGLGGSAGGITIGGAFTWRPDLFAVALDLVGMSDGLRIETTPNGPPNISEFGTVKSEAGFHGLYAMSAYEHVRKGVQYPAIMFATGMNDPRVAPWQMTKMAALLQASGTKRPVLLRIDYDAGHGVGSTAAQREALLADLWSFALWQVGDPQFQPAGGPGN